MYRSTAVIEPNRCMGRSLHRRIPRGVSPIMWTHKQRLIPSTDRADSRSEATCAWPSGGNVFLYLIHSEIRQPAAGVPVVKRQPLGPTTPKWECTDGVPKRPAGGNTPQYCDPESGGHPTGQQHLHHFWTILTIFCVICRPFWPYLDHIMTILRVIPYIKYYSCYQLPSSLNQLYITKCRLQKLVLFMRNSAISNIIVVKILNKHRWERPSLT